MLNDASVWQHVLPLLPANWHVCIANVTTQNSMEAMAHDAWHQVSNLNSDQPLIIAGFSMGGYVALEMLAKPARSVQAAALLSTSILPESAEGRVVREKTMAAMQANFAKVVECILKFGTHEADEAVLAPLRQMQLGIGSEVAIRQTQAIMARNDHRAQLAQLSLPMALMCGEHDRVTPPDLTRQIHACMPHASVTWVPTGHMLPVQAPLAVAQGLEALWHSTLTT